MVILSCHYLVTQLQVMIARGLGFVEWQKHLKGVAQNNTTNFHQSFCCSFPFRWLLLLNTFFLSLIGNMHHLEISKSGAIIQP